MAAKYVPLPTDDCEVNIMYPGGRDTTGERYPEYFSYTSKQTESFNNYRSAFTYSNLSDSRRCENIEVSVEPASVVHITIASFLTIFLYLLVFITFPISWFFVLKHFKENERCVVYRVGRVLGVKGPGRIIILPLLDNWQKVDISTRAFSIPPLVIMTEDKGGVEVGGDVFFSVVDPIKMVSGVQDLNHALRILSQTSLQRHLSKHDMAKIFRDKSIILAEVKEELNKAAEGWGVSIAKLDLTTIKVIQEPMAPMSTVGNPLNLLQTLLFPPGTAMPGSAANSAPTGSFGNVVLPGFTGLSGAPSSNSGLPSTASGIFPGFPGSVPSLVTADQIPQMYKTDSATNSAQQLPRQESTSGRDIVNSIIDQIRPNLSHDLVQDIGNVYQFIILGSNGGTFYLDLKNGSGSIGEGDSLDRAYDTIITLTEEDLLELVSGRMSPFNAYLSGKIQIEGDLQATTSLKHLFSKLIGQ